MAVDPSVSLGLKFPDPASQPNALDTVGKFATIQNNLNQNKLFQQTFAARQQAGHIMATAPDLETGLSNLYKDPQVAPFAGEMVGQIRQGMLAGVQYQGEVQKQATSGYDAVIQGLPAMLASPTEGTWKNAIESKLGTLSPLARKQVEPILANMKTALLDGLPDDPAAAKAEFAKRVAGFSLATGAKPEAISGILGPATSQDTGGKIQFGRTAPPQGGPAGEAPGSFIPGNALGKTLAPTLTDVPVGEGSTVKEIVGGDSGQGNPLTAVAKPGTDSANPLLPEAAAGPKIPPGAIGARTPTLTEGEYAPTRTKHVADYEKDLDDRVNTGGTFRRNMDEIIGAAKQAQAGGGAETYAKLGAALQAFGVDNDVVNKMANGSLAASQVIDKASLSNTMNQLKQQLTGIGGSRINQQEFVAQLSKNPNLSTDPNAIVQVFNLWNDFYKRDKAEQTALDAYKEKGGDIKRWPQVWNNSEFMKGFAPGTSISGEGVKGITKPAGGERPPLDSFLK